MDAIVDQHDGWCTVWACEPPEPGARFVIVSASWNADYTVRIVHAWKPSSHELATTM